MRLTDALSMENIGRFFGFLLAVAVGGAWAVGGMVGTIYWALKDEMVSALLSVFIPMYGAISVILDIAGV